METNTNKYTLPLAIVAAGALIAGAIYYGDTKQSAISGQKQVAANAEVDVPPVRDTDHILGARSAELFIIEYSDTECPFCKSFHYTMKEILRTYGGKVAWVYRHFPIATLHARAAKESEATECAAELGGNEGFWKYLDRLFEVTKSNDTLDPQELPKIASYVGFDTTAFNNCLSSGKYAELVQKSVEEAVKAGARGTPYSIIMSRDGKKALINGAEPIDMVRAKIDALLK